MKSLILPAIVLLFVLVACLPYIVPHRKKSETTTGGKDG